MDTKPKPIKKIIKSIPKSVPKETPAVPKSASKPAPKETPAVPKSAPKPPLKETPAVPKSAPKPPLKETPAVPKSAPKPASKPLSGKPPLAPKLDGLTVIELRAEAKSKGIAGISKMKRAELLEALSTIPKTRTSPVVYTMVLDTETTGLPDRQPKETYPPYTDTDKYDNARVVQWTWGLYDDSGSAVEIYDYIIKPEGFEIPEESVKFHKITTERANKEGVAFEIVAEKFLESLDRVHVIVGHNIMFDLSVIKSELYRRLLAKPATSGPEGARLLAKPATSGPEGARLLAKPATSGPDPKIIIRAIDAKGIICTMSNSRDVCALARQSAQGYKFPSLKELYTHIVDEAPDVDKLHNALYDVECTATCYFGLLSRTA